MMKYSPLVHLQLVLSIACFLSMMPMQGQGFQRTYGTAYEDHGYQIILTQDSQYAVLGSYGGKFPIYLLKVSTLGETIWQKIYRIPDGFAAHECSFQQTADGGFVIASTARSAAGTKQDIIIVRTDSEGNLLWNTVFTGLEKGYTKAGAYDLTVTEDNGIVVTGNLKSSDDLNVLLFKLDSTGVLQWAKNYGGIEDEEGYSVRETTDGGLIVAGYTDSYGQGEHDAYLLKVNSSGDIQWTTTYGGLMDDYAKQVALGPDGTLLLTGTTSNLDSNGIAQSDLFVLKVDSLGSMLWATAIGDQTNEGGSSIKQDLEGGFLVTGFTDSSSTGLQDIYLVRIDSMGAMDWSRSFGGLHNDKANDLIRHGASFILVGDTRNFSRGSTDVYFIKVDSSWTDSCHQHSINLAQTALTWETGSGGVGYSGGSMIDADFVLGVADYSFVDACDCVPPIADYFASITHVCGWFEVYGNNVDYWHWDFGEGTVSIEESVTFCGEGYYNVCIYVQNSCGEDSACQVFGLFQGLDETNNSNTKLNIYPNPLSHYTEVTFENAAQEPLVLQLMDVQGRVVLQRNDIRTDRVRIEKGSIPSGNYLVTLASERGIKGADKLVVLD